VFLLRFIARLSFASVAHFVAIPDSILPDGGAIVPTSPSSQAQAAHAQHVWNPSSNSPRSAESPMREKRVPAWQSSRDPNASKMTPLAGKKDGGGGGGSLENSGGPAREHKPMQTFLMRQSNRLSQKIDPSLRLSDSSHRLGVNRSGASSSFDVHRLVSSSPLAPLNHYHDARSQGVFQFMFCGSFFFFSFLHKLTGRDVFVPIRFCTFICRAIDFSGH
jgi:hypothetical protein